MGIKRITLFIITTIGFVFFICYFSVVAIKSNAEILRNQNSNKQYKHLSVNNSLNVLENYSATSSDNVKDELSFTFAGDCMFGRNVGYYYQKNNFKDLFINLQNNIFSNTNIFWLNLEGPISDKNVIQSRERNNLVFNFSYQTIEALKYLKITTAGLANNHTANQGKVGLNKTKEILQQAKIDWNGDPNKVGENSVKHYQQGNIKVALLSVNVLASAINVEKLIKQEKSNNYFVIILPHWGNEYQTTHSSNQEKLARLWIIAGADLIIGSHPHVVQDAQIINKKLVFYSLGNFIFDQTFSVETQQGLIIAGIINDEKTKIVLTPIVSKKMKPEIMDGIGKKKIINRICHKLGDFCKQDVIEIKR